MIWIIVLSGLCSIAVGADNQGMIVGTSLDGRTNGTLWVDYSKGRFNVLVLLNPVPEALVISAWLVWIDRNSTTPLPAVFDIANRASPLTPYTARFSSGFARNPHEFKYYGKTVALLRQKLNFNPTYPNEGPLARRTYSYQNDIPGINQTIYNHYPGYDGLNFPYHVPTSSDYLRQYVNVTGYEVLDANGLTTVARSPIKALGIEVISHRDKVTHGIAQGIEGVDHDRLVFFNFGTAIGSPTAR